VADGGEQQPARFSAFISYSRADVAAARRIHAQLETYRLPHRLHPENQAWNEKTRRLKPVFRDHDELTAAPDLGEALQTALAQSQFLIVLCSPASAKSEWVGREIDMFRRLHGDHSILAALIDGSPAEAFHPALSHGGHGDLRPLAADFRPTGDGKRLALLKLVAVMAGVGLGELVQRDAQRRMRNLAMIFATVVIVLAIVAGLIFLTMNARLAAERERARGSALSGYMLEDLRKELKSAGRLDLLQALNKGVNNYYAGQDLSQLSDAELELRAKLLLAMGEDDEQRGDLAKAREHIEEARRTTAKLLAAKPDDSSRIFAHAQSEYYAGMINWRGGNRAGAAQGFQGYKALAEKLLKQDSSNADWWMEKGWAEDNLGMFVLRTDVDTVAAAIHFKAALAAFDAADRLRPGDKEIVSAKADGLAWLADTERLSGHFAAAREMRAAQRALLDRLAAADPLDKVVQADIVSNRLALGRIMAAEGRHKEAIELFEDGHAAAAGLAQDDQQNIRNARQVRVFDLFSLRSWLALPPPDRPDGQVLAVANGNCITDRTILKSDELGQFCEILEARRTGKSLLRKSNADQTNQLSEMWGIDFIEEEGDR
jgi:tetratricopeptide (TPR) repeat protein